MKSDMTRVLVESTIRRTLKAMRESPEREARNLVDAGAQFSTGRFQTRLISHAQRMLQNSKSAYYALVKDVVTYADHDNIATFGVNLGYNSCTKGARLIRETEREKGFNIPWALHLRVSQEKLAGDPGLYPSILREGTSLGIYTYLLFVPGDAQAVLPLVMEYPDCAFLLFLEGGQITPAFLEAATARRRPALCAAASGWRASCRPGLSSPFCGPTSPAPTGPRRRCTSTSPPCGTASTTP